MIRTVESENATTLRYAPTAIADAVGAATDGHVDWAHGFFVGHREGPGHRAKLSERERVRLASYRHN